MVEFTQKQLRSGMNRTQQVRSAEIQRVKEQPVQVQPTVTVKTSEEKEIEAQQIAEEWVNRKIAGKKIVRSLQYASSPEEREILGMANQLYKEMLSNKETMKAVSAGNERFLSKECPKEYVSAVKAERTKVQEEIKSKLPAGEVPVFSKASGRMIGTESGALQKSYKISDYNKEVTRINKLAPIQVYVNPITKEESSKQKPYGLMAYATPSGKILKTEEEVREYMIKNKLPMSNLKITTPTQLQEYTGTPTIYSANVRSEFKPTDIRDEIKLGVTQAGKDLWTGMKRDVGAFQGKPYEGAGFIQTLGEKTFEGIYWTGSKYGTMLLPNKELVLSKSKVFNPTYVEGQKSPTGFGSELFTTPITREQLGGTTLTLGAFVSPAGGYLQQLWLGGIAEKTTLGTARAFTEGKPLEIPSRFGKYVMENPVQAGAEGFIIANSYFSIFRKRAKIQKVFEKPEVTITKVQATYGTKLKTVISPKTKVTLGNKPIISEVRAGRGTARTPTAPFIESVTTSPMDKSYKVIQFTGGSGEIAGQMQRTIKVGGLFPKKYFVQFQSSPTGKEIIYDVITGGKVVKRFTEPISRGYFGFGEPYATKNIRVTKTEILPSKAKIRTIKGDRIYTQNIIPTAKGYDVKGNVRTTILTERTSAVSPAKSDIIIRRYQGDKMIKETIPVSSKLPKFSRVNPPDIEQIRTVAFKGMPPTDYAVISEFMQTPKYVDFTKQLARSRGTFTIVTEKSGMVNVPELKWLQSKRAELRLFDKLNLRPNLVLNPSVSLQYTPRSKFYLTGGVIIPTIETGTSGGLFPAIAYGLTPKGTTEIKTSPQLDFSPRVDLSNISIPEERVSNQTKFDTKTILETRQVQEPIQQQVSLQKLQTQFRTKLNIEMPRLEIPRLEIPKINPPIITLESPKLKLSPAAASKIYDIFVRRWGKDIKISSALDIEQASIKLKKNLITTLAASGFVKERGAGKLKASTLGLGSEFRVSKYDISRLVQKRNRRLKGRSEIIEIKTTRKRKGRKLKWW